MYNKKVNNALVYVDDNLKVSDDNGMITINFKTNGNHYLYAEKDGYIRSDKIIISVSKDIELVKPIKNSLYMFNKNIKNDLKNTLIIGPITFELKHENYIEKVEFYVNDRLVFVDNETPFKYHLNQRSFFKKTSILIQSYQREEMDYTIYDLINNINQLLIQHEIDQIIELIKEFINQHSEKSLIPADSIEINVLIFNLFPDVHKIFETMSFK